MLDEPCQVRRNKLPSSWCPWALSRTQVYRSNSHYWASLPNGKVRGCRLISLPKEKRWSTKPVALCGFRIRDLSSLRIKVGPLGFETHKRRLVLWHFVFFWTKKLIVRWPTSLGILIGPSRHHCSSNIGSTTARLGDSYWLDGKSIIISLRCWSSSDNGRTWPSLESNVSYNTRQYIRCTCPIVR